MSIEIFSQNKVTEIPVINDAENPLFQRAAEESELLVDYPIIGKLAEIGLSAVQMSINNSSDASKALELLNNQPILQPSTLDFNHEMLYWMNVDSDSAVNYDRYVAGMNLFRAALMASRLFTNVEVKNNDYVGQLGDKIFQRTATAGFSVQKGLDEAKSQGYGGQYKIDSVSAGINGFEAHPDNTRMQFSIKNSNVYNPAQVMTRSITLKTGGRNGLVDAEITSARWDGTFAQHDSTDDQFMSTGSYAHAINAALSEK